MSTYKVGDKVRDAVALRVYGRSPVGTVTAIWDDSRVGVRWENDPSGEAEMAWADELVSA